MLWLLLIAGILHAQEYTVGTFNLRYDNRYDSGNLWENRAPVVAALIRFHGFDVLGTQEGLQNQLADISKALPEYQRYGVGRDNGIDSGEHSAIFFRKDKFTLLNKGDFWLSQTPAKPSLGWDAKCCKRICSWIQLKDKTTGKSFYFFNAHYDHEGVEARIESSRLMLQKVTAIAGKTPALITGDLNGGYETDCYKILATSGVVKDVRNAAAIKYVNNGSFNNWGKSVERADVIDHIFATSQFTVTIYGILTDTYRGKYPSDHFPVLAKIKL
ncbi:bacillopeptidase F precursor [Filimonas lacunae]|nr:bacillopeptidase F precursor [Filimonas lacunae]